MTYQNHHQRPPDRGRWSTEGYLARKFKKQVVEFRKFDVTFSTSNELPGDTLIEKRQGIYTFLRKIEAIKPDEDVKDVIKRMKIGFNKSKEQVIMECISVKKAEQVYLPLLEVPAAPAVENGLYRVTHVDANYFKDEKIPIYISWVRSSIDIKKYIIDGFLSNYGEVLDHKPIFDNEGVETFEHVFYMKHADIQANPPPNFLWLGNNKLKVRFRGQVQTCWICDKDSHKAYECPSRQERRNDGNPSPCGNCQSTTHTTAQCRFHDEQRLAEYRRDFPTAFEEARKRAIAAGYKLRPVSELVASPNSTAQIPEQVGKENLPVTSS